MKLWINGGLKDAAEARVSALDHGLTVGDGVFETLKTVRGLPFALTLHLERLTRSAAALGLPEPDHDEIRRACAEVIDANPMERGRLRVTYTGGTASLGSERVDQEPTLVVALGAMPARPRVGSVITVPWTRNERGALAGLKSTSYAENVIALARATERGASEALFANTAGQLCEGTASNVFVVLDGELHTPPVSSGCLPGITRALVVAWAGALETALPHDVLDRAEEVFLTSSLRDVQAVDRIDGRPVGTAPGPVTAKTQRIFEERAAADPDPRLP
ncbi:aminotransferase class IV [Streptomyces clavuligerus]|uniref:aminodeoxychorismate lyase n=1 Tax=Streptomyces clavuligerus TaxID=1901 RepID=E2PVA3_STRCL|nr:aminodeoxychorismate lyase [Streptomyces clavuligerus]ANW21067.1 4-amino-4-deoxychorismate lyase [Streptomyces clavuligerus]AXU15686.1 aminodeoxychorismate lyase [Streptomyces clavuligerus]EFG05850.1 aminotransferase [Streptomyces clavuligerus]MBY6305805.1 aminodeoxychorismate lyase [Streptomyces clavuligerus]QCS08465.1 aminodeoxychorismate lyase [Streptomyces clavuligerus]